MKEDADFNLRFATMLRGMASRLESGDWILEKSEHAVNINPKVTEQVSFTIKPKVE